MRPFEAINNPAVPFVDVIQGGLQPASIVTIHGYALPSAKNFAVNFALGTELGVSDIAFHFNPRFDENYVARNHFQKGTWGSKEESSGTMNLKRGETFELLFLVEPNEIKVAINGQHFCGFAHRMPYEHINTLQIAGDVQIAKVQLHGPQALGPSPVMNPTLPFEHPIPGWIEPGRIVTIIGHPKSFPDRFQINLVSRQKGEDVLFHFNPRYDPARYIVRNSCIDGFWGEENTDTPFFNLMPDAKFNIKIVCEPEHFSVFLNEQHFCYFKHRLPFNLITHIAIAGDVDIESIHFS